MWFMYVLCMLVCVLSVNVLGCESRCSAYKIDKSCAKLISICLISKFLSIRWECWRFAWMSVYFKMLIRFPFGCCCCFCFFFVCVSYRKIFECISNRMDNEWSRSQMVFFFLLLCVTIAVTVVIGFWARTMLALNVFVFFLFECCLVFFFSISLSA